MKQPFVIIVATVLSAAALNSQELIFEPIDLQLLPSERRLDSIQTFSSMFHPEGPIIPQTDIKLSEHDYEEVARELGVEVAAIKAVVDIETGNTHEGFWAPGRPLLNFDLTIYKQRLRAHGIPLARAQKEVPEVFAPLNIKKYGSRQAAMQARLDAALRFDRETALESVFWGMFQIGGFNYKKCGAATVEQFVEQMSRTERDQLNLFAEFCRNNDLVKYIKNKDWAGFSLRYNGPSYAARGYHTKMARSYAAHSRK